MLAAFSGEVYFACILCQDPIFPSRKILIPRGHHDVCKVYIYIFAGSPSKKLSDFNRKFIIFKFTTYRRCKMGIYECSEHPKKLGSLDKAIDHARSCHSNFIKRPGRLGNMDSHGHLWYCFACEGALNDHRSYDSNRAMWNHLKTSHKNVVEDIFLN